MSKRSQAIEAAFLRAQRLHAAGRLAEAEQGYRQILAAAPDHADSRHLLGVVALQAGYPAAALAEIDAAIARAPRQALYHANRGNALVALGRPEEAEAACREALRHKRNSAEAWQTLGHALGDQGRAAEAVAAYQEALRQNARLPDLHNSLGLALHDAARLEEAREALAEAARRAPGDALVEGNLAGVLKDLGRLEEAEALYRAILRRRPEDPTAHFNLGVLLLLAGRTAEAWPDWDWRFRAEPAMARDIPGTPWMGEALAGRSLLVHAEQGIGDMIHFARFLPLLPRDGTVVLEAHPPLLRLFSQLPGVARVVPLGEKPPACDMSVPMMSLPARLGLADPAALAGPGPYLRADPAEVARWRTRLAGLPGRRVGLVFAGNPGRVRMDRRRSVPPALLAPLASVPGVSFVSLQKPRPVAGTPEFVLDLADELGDFADTAALVAALDLVIGVDTAVVHLAGALGRPVWLLNRFDTDWRWGLGTADSFWYPSLRQFRQQRAGDWASVIAEVAAALADGQCPAPYVRCSSQ